MGDYSTLHARLGTHTHARTHALASAPIKAVEARRRPGHGPTASQSAAISIDPTVHK